MSGKNGKGRGDGGRSQGGQKAPRGRGGAHGTKPSQRREAKNQTDSLETKRIDQVRDKLGALIETLSNEEVLRVLKKHEMNVEQACEALLAGDISSEDESSSEEDGQS